MTTSPEGTATSDAPQDGATDTTAEQATTDTSAPTSTTSPAPGATAEQSTEQSQTFDAAYVAKLRAESAKYRNEAKANADAARKLAEIEDANKSEAQRLQDARAAAEKDAADARTEALRWRIAAAHGISTDDAALFLTGADEATMTQQAEVLAAKNRSVTTPSSSTATPPAPAPQPGPRPDLSQGARGAAPTDPASSFAAFFKGQLNS